jgi:hypothetical protein
MELDELKKIWNEQNQPIYMVDQSTLHRHVVAKRNAGDRIAHYSEILSIASNLLAGSFILVANLIGGNHRISLYLLSLWMIAAGIYVAVKRVWRITGEKQFDRSMMGDVRYALQVATYQVRLSYLMRWNIVPMGVLLMLSMWEGGKSIWLTLGLLAFLSITLFASGFEHDVYKRRRNELERLKTKLESDV